MENTKTLNIISTPNIEGNIGSCETKIAIVDNGRTLWRETHTSIATNNCTGIVNTYDTWEFSDFFASCIIVPITIIFCIGIAWATITDLKDNHHNY
jgi:energy-converting hydrogenase Eha subunit H